MTKSFQDLVRDAEANVPKVTAKEAHQASLHGDLILDVREPAELEQDGRIENALNIPRGILEPRACDEAELKEAELCQSSRKRVHVLCASGARATLAANTLRTMGYDATVIAGGLKSWKEAGLEIKNS